jgi:hypothetical protein
MADVDYYTVAYDDGTGWKPLPPGAGRTLTRRWMYHDGTDWHSGSRAFPYDTATFPGFAVYESREHFENNGPYSDWYPGGSRFWVSNEFMIFRLNSAKFPDGTYHFQVTGYEKNAAGNLVNGAPLPFCCTPDDNDLVLTFDNRVIDPMLDTASNPCSTEITNCTVHMCTTEPTTDFLSVSIDGVEVDPCGVVEASTGMLEIVFEASDPGNHLGTYTLFAKYGENGYVNLLNLLSEPGSSLTAASGQQGPTYGEALSQGAVAPYWSGGIMTLVVPADKAFPVPCCYQLELRALKRTLVNCHSAHYGHCNLSEYTIGVGVCPPEPFKPPVVTPID